MSEHGFDALVIAGGLTHKELAIPAPQPDFIPVPSVAMIRQGHDDVLQLIHAFFIALDELADVVEAQFDLARLFVTGGKIDPALFGFPAHVVLTANEIAGTLGRHRNL